MNLYNEPINDKVLLVTGAREGIGRYLAEYYAARGFQVIGCSRKASDFRHERYRHFTLDVADAAAARKMFAQIRKNYGRLDALINNAGVNPAIGPAMLLDPRSARATMETNFLGSYVMSVEAAKLMMKNRFGRIVMLGSMAVRHEVAGESIYTASKAAVTAFTRVFAKEVQQFGITCNVVAPAAVPTKLSRAVDARALAEVLKRNAIPKPGAMKDVGNAVDFILKPESAAITGQVIYLGGV